MSELDTAQSPRGLPAAPLFALVRAVTYLHKLHWMVKRCWKSRRLPRMIVTESKWEATFWLLNLPYRLVDKIESRRGGVSKCQWELVWHDSTLIGGRSLERCWQSGVLVGVPKMMVKMIHEPIAINATGNSNGVDSPTIGNQLLNPIAMIVVNFCN
ncbi:MAG: hypothetical protein ABL921_34675, partial [Pirellula sp.]